MSIDTAPRLAPRIRQASAVPANKAIVKMVTFLPLFSVETKGARTSQEWPQGLTPWMRPSMKLDCNAAASSVSISTQTASVLILLDITKTISKAKYFENQTILLCVEIYK
jgi:hypothetical protein